MFVVFYAKAVDDKQEGIYISDIYFGGVGETMVEATKVAKDCVNTIKGGTILPKISELVGDCQLIPVMKSVIAKFRKLEREMFLAEDILNRNNKKKT